MKQLALACLLLCSGCIGYVRTRSEVPVPEAALAQLQAGHTDLAATLRLLGAPTHVLEEPQALAVLVYAWEDSDDWSVDLSVPLGKGGNAKLEYDSTETTRQGVVLWFSTAGVLQRWQQGRVGELLARRRPVETEVPEQSARVLSPRPPTR